MSARAPRLATGLALLLAAGSAAAQPSEEGSAEEELPVAVECTLGLGGVLPDRGFAPVRVGLTSRDVARTVSVEVQSVSGSNVLLRLGPVELEPGIPRRVEGIAPIGRLVEAGELRARAVDPDAGLVGRVRLTPDPTPGPVLAAVHREGSAPTDLSSLEVAADGSGRGREVGWRSVALADRRALPESPLGYTGLGALLLGEVDFAAWTEGEARALAGWVARGGHLVLSVGARARELRRSLVGRRLGAALAPLRDAEPHRRASLRAVLTALGDARASRAGSGEAADPEREEPAAGDAATAPASARLVPADGDEVLYADDAGRPLVVRRAHGRGRVTLVAADLWAPPFRHARVTRRLLEEVLAHGPRYAAASQVIFKDLAHVRQPARVGPAFAVLILYALLAGPGVYFFLRAKKRGILLWLAIPAATIGFTALVPLYRLALRDAESTLVGVRLRQGASGRPTWVDTTDVMVFSGSLEEKRLEYAGADVTAFGVIPPPPHASTPRLGRALGSRSGELEVALPVALWGVRYVSFEDVVPEGPRVAGSVELGLDSGSAGSLGARLRVRYEGAAPLEDAIVVYPGLSGALIHPLEAPLAPGEELAQEIEVPVHASTYEAGKDLEHLIMDRRIVAAVETVEEHRDRAVLLGRTDDRAPLRALPNVRTRAFADVLEVELGIRYRGGVPYDVAQTTREAATLAPGDSDTVEREVRTRFRLPGGPEREVAALELRATAEGVAALDALQLDVWEPEARSWRRLALDDSDTVERGGAGRRLTVSLTSPPASPEAPDPARWIGGEGDERELRFRQRFRRSVRETDASHRVELDVQLRWAGGGG